MGFGTLFFGYFILLDLPYQTLTNVCAAAIMILALYKLSYLNANMKRAFRVCSVFLVFAGYEAVVDALDMLFSIEFGGVALNTASYLIRNVLIGMLSVLMLLGMKDVSAEIGLNKLSKKCDIYSKITLTVYVFNLTVPPDLSTIFGATPTAIYIHYFLLVITTILTLYVLVMNCLNIYSCYAKICMPSDNDAKEREAKKSRSSLVNKFKEHEEEKRREYAEYKLEKTKKRNERRQNKKK